MTNCPKNEIKWASIRPDAEYYSTMIAKLGITGIEVQQLNNLDRLTDTLQPEITFGIIIRYNNSENEFYQRTKDPRSSNIFFAKQPKTISCPIMALINTLCNLDVDKGKVLQGILNEYFDSKFPLGSFPAHPSEEIKKMHNAYCWAKQQASPSHDIPEIHNMVSYICKGKDIWKFDSQKDCAFKLRAYGNWLYLLQDILKEKSQDIADIIALVKEPLVKQEETLQLVIDTPDEEDEVMLDIKLEESIEHMEDVNDQGSTESSPISKKLNPICDPNRREKTSWNLGGKQIKSAGCRLEEINRRTRAPITKVKTTNINGKGKATNRKSIPKTTSSSSKKGAAPGKKASGKKNAISGKKGAASCKKDTTSSKNGTTSGKKDTASGKNGTTSTKKSTESNKNGKTSGATSCSKKKGQKRSRDEEDDEGDKAERKRYCNTRNSYNLRSR